jgi:hypothetical protein
MGWSKMSGAFYSDLKGAVGLSAKDPDGMGLPDSLVLDHFRSFCKSLFSFVLTFQIFLFGYLNSSASAWETTANFLSSSKDSVKTGKVIAPSEAAVVLEPPSEFIVPFPDDSIVFLGEGFDLISGKRRPSYCVTIGKAEQVNFNDKTASISQVTDEESLFRKLNRSISASGSYVGYSAGGSYQDSSEFKSSSKEITVVAKADIKSFAITMKPPRNVYRSGNLPTTRFDLTEDAVKLLMNPGTFREICGDGYVSQITYGADLYSVFRYSSLDYEQKRSMKVSFSASGPGGMFSASGSQEQEEKVTKLKISESINVAERGGKAAPLANDRASLVAQYSSFAERVAGHERPMFITVKRYSSLPAFKKASDVVVMYDNFELLVRRALRIKSLIPDLNDAIEQTRGGYTREYFVEDRAVLPNGPRSLDGLIRQRDHLKEEFKKAQIKIQTCMKEPNLVNCEIDTNRLYVASASRPVTSLANATASDDLAIRALSPLAINSVSPQEIAGWKAFLTKGRVFGEFAVCSIAATVARSNVDSVADNRCVNDNECLREEELASLRSFAFEGFGFDGVAISEGTCGNISNPFPQLPAGPVKINNLAIVRLGAGQTFSISATSDSGEPNFYDLSLVCPNLKIAEWKNLNAGAAIETIRFPRMNMNCNVEVRAFHGGGGANTIFQEGNLKNFFVNENTYEAVPQVVSDKHPNLSELVAKFVVPTDDYLQVDRDRNDLVIFIEVYR